MAEPVKKKLPPTGNPSARPPRKEPVIVGQKRKTTKVSQTIKPKAKRASAQHKPHVNVEKKFTEKELIALKKQFKDEQKAEKERIRRKRRVENYRRLEHWRKNKKLLYQRILFGTVIGGFFYLVLLCFGTIGFVLYLNTGHASPKNTLRVGVEYPVSGSARLTTIYDLQVERDGVTYLPVDVLDALSEITLTGDYDVYSILLSNGEIARFTLNRDSCELNGNKTLLSGNCFVSNGKLYLPVDFYETKMYGFDVARNEEKKTLSFHKNDEEFSFSFKYCTPETPIPYDDSLIPTTE
jgi:hypothetical protein